MKQLGLQLWNRCQSLSMVQQIALGILAGVSLALLVPQASFCALFGTFFVDALKAMSPLLVFFMVMDSLSHHNHTNPAKLTNVMVLYLASMLLASLTAVLLTLYFYPVLVLQDTVDTAAPSATLGETLANLLACCVQNPVESLVKANYIGILLWAVLFGLMTRRASESTRQMIADATQIICRVLTIVVRFAPLGVMGLMFSAIASEGLGSMMIYGRLILVLVGIMLVVALVLNPLLVYVAIRRNPYPLVWKCLKDSGMMAFLTRSSAANIPINMGLCQELKLDPSIYSVSIPLGATLNKCGGVVTLATMTLATVATLHLDISLSQIVLLCLMVALCASGSSGVVGGSLLLIPLTCSVFGISNDISMQAVGVGFVISFIQDSCETALNSSSDPLLTAAAEYASQRKK